MDVLNNILEKANTGKIDEISPVFNSLLSVRENDGFHDNDPVLLHIKRVVYNVINLTAVSSSVRDYFSAPLGGHSRGELLTVAAVFHDIAKGLVLTAADGKTSCPDHERAGAEMTREYLEKEGAGKEESDYIVSIIMAHGLPHRYLKADNADAEAGLAVLASAIPDIYPDILVFTKADVAGSQLVSKNRQLYDFINAVLDREIGRCFSSLKQ